MLDVPDVRIRVVNKTACQPAGKYVLYWMIAARRTAWNFGLQRAVHWARQLGRPLLVFEPLRCGYDWASRRLHQFVIAGMADNARAFRERGVLYYPYLEPEPGAGRGLLSALAREAAVVVSDDCPCFFYPHMLRAAARQIPVQFEAVDSNGLFPLAAADRVFARAFDFRRFLQKQIRPHLEQFPAADPLADRPRTGPAEPPRPVTRQWPAADVELLAVTPERLAEFPIAQQVAISPTAGGAQAAAAVLRRFVFERLPRYEQARNEPEQTVTSGLSPYLHFGHISAHQVFREVMDRVRWTPVGLELRAHGSAQGWWGAPPEVEAFVDQLVTWRELGFNMCHFREDYEQYESLPQWAQQTLAQHAQDPREYVYSLAEFESAATHDPLWNAAQRQLVREGAMHNYLRMLWGKKILQWTAHPREALAVMLELNNKYALDGRDPNSYSGIFWTLGRYDRAWGPERPIFGKVRYMSSENTARKVRVKGYLAQYGPA